MLKPSSAKKSAIKAVPKKKRTVQQTDLNLTEEQRLEDLILRFQAIVVSRNKRTNERARADVSEPEIVRAGLLKLEETSDDDLHALVLKAKNRE